MKDLILLVADKNAHFALRGALSRASAMGIRPVTADFIVHPGRDGGARKTGPELLALKRMQFRHALLVLDFEGSGAGFGDSSALEAELDRRLSSTWGSRAKTIVIEPELDVWVWGSDNAMASIIDWPAGTGVRDWLHRKGFAFTDHEKPCRPKEAIEAVLGEMRIPRSSALYEEFAKRISLRRCLDAAFVRLRRQLLEWFPELGSPPAHECG